MMSFLSVEKISHSYNDKVTFKNVSFQLEKNKILALMGPSGVGKTTLLRCLLGFEAIDSGKITVGTNVLSTPERLVPPKDRNMGLVMQHYALFPNLSVEQNILFGIQRLPKVEKQSRLNELLEMTQLRHLKGSLPSQLSGGQQQRVAIARALAIQPSLLLLDEPFANMDSKLKNEIKHSLKTILNESNITTIIVTHNFDEVGDIVTDSYSM